ncbi:MAG: hypothetical protein ACK5PP_18170 [Acidimicrobiales bacterium]
MKTAASRSSSSSPTSVVPAWAERAGLWPLRVLWFLLPVLAGPAVDGLVAGADRSGRLVVAAGAWLAYLVGMVAALTPSPQGLTAIRVLSPVVVAIGLAALVVGDATAADALVAAGAGIVVSLVAFSPLVGDRMINGSAYGSERRMALRPPGGVLLGPVELVWVLIVLGLTGPIALAASGRPVWAVVALVPGLGMAWFGVRAVYQLARRWLVFVPAGFVIHDHMLMAEAILLRRSSLVAVGLATTEDTDPETVADATGAARGLVLEAVAREPFPYAIRQRGQLHDRRATRIRFSPSLPGAVLAEARIRGVTIGRVPDEGPADPSGSEPAGHDERADDPSPPTG